MKRVKKISVLVLLLGVMFAMSISTQAATGYQKLYSRLLKQKSVTVRYSSGYSERINMNYFILLDISGDGRKELITSPSRGFNSIIHVFYVKSGKVWYAGEELNKYHGGKIAYSKKYKGLVLENGGSGAAGNSIIQLKNGRLKEKYSYQMQSTARGDLTFFNNKQVSKSTFYAKKNKYFSRNTIKSYAMYYNNARNRGKRVK